MPTFIDESGTSSPDNRRYFHLTAVWVPTQEAAQPFRDEIATLRDRHRFPAAMEFKFENAHNHPASTRDFFDCALRIPFRFSVCSIDKQSASWQGQDRRVLFWAATVHLAVCLWPRYLEQEDILYPRPLNESVVVDDNKDNEYLRILKRSFRGIQSRRRSHASLTRHITFGRSSTNEMLQLADMVCGAVAEEIRLGRSEWLDAIRHRGDDFAILQ